jgi:MoxR-like ATPase
MEEREITIGKETLKLPSPFLVLATQNSQEEQGVFPLPEAQIDRFLFKIKMGYLKRDLEKKIMDNNIEVKDLEDFNLKEVVTLKDILEVQDLVKQIELPEEVKGYSLRIISASRYPEKYGYEMHEYVEWGGSPRATISLNLAGRANALLEGRDHVEIKDIKEVVYDVLRHRIILSYEGKAKNIDIEEVIESMISGVPTLM